LVDAHLQGAVQVGLDFKERIAEGFVIEAYNSTKDCDSDRISLRAYSLPAG